MGRLGLGELERYEINGWNKRLKDRTKWSEVVKEARKHRNL